MLLSGGRFEGKVSCIIKSPPKSINIGTFSQPSTLQETAYSWQKILEFLRHSTVVNFQCEKCWFGCKMALIWWLISLDCKPGLWSVDIPNWDSCDRLPSKSWCLKPTNLIELGRSKFPQMHYHAAWIHFWLKYDTAQILFWLATLLTMEFSSARSLPVGKWQACRHGIPGCRGNF